MQRFGNFSARDVAELQDGGDASDADEAGFDLFSSSGFTDYNVNERPKVAEERHGNYHLGSTCQPSDIRNLGRVLGRSLYGTQKGGGNFEVFASLSRSVVNDVLFCR